MKIGIITFHSAHNYGAVLQAWSLQEYLKQQGHQVEIVNLRLPVIDRVYQLTKKTKKKVCGSDAINRLVNGAYHKVRCTSFRFRDSVRYQKYIKFERFIRKKLPITREFLTYGDLLEANLQYDALIAGSDQIWNSTITKGINPAYFLNFGNRDALRISYAASIGGEKIPPQFHLMFQRYLRDFDCISVREQKAADQLQELIDQPIEVVADPTFLLKREDFDCLVQKPKRNGGYIYVHNVHLKRVDEGLNSVAEEMSKRLNLPIVHNWNETIFANEAGHFTGGIEEFLGYVSQAEYVITNSFHCTVFALIYRRNFITVPHYANPDRMRYLLEELGLSSHLIEKASKIPEDLSKLQIDYQAVEQKKETMGSHARDFLDRALKMKKVVDDRTYFETGDKFRCYGCAACKDICPVGAITMQEDKEGFQYPVIDESICIHCDKCRKTCIYHQDGSKNIQEEKFPLVYAACSPDEQLLYESASGGMFTALYHGILKKGGSVVGVRYDENMKVVYDIADAEEGCERFRRSKYVFADCGDVKQRVKEVLQKGNPVLYSGTPCQIAGLNSYLGKPYTNLYTVELICHGASSPKVFKKYCDHLEKVYRSKIVDFQFRNKFKGVDNPFVLVEFELGSIHLENMLKNNFTRAFRSNNIQRPSCFQCEYVGRRAGVADLTIGDYWGIQQEHPEFADERGVSLVKINTRHGQELFEEIKGELKLQESTYEKAYAHNYSKLMVMYDARSRLMYYIDDKPIDDLLLTFNRLKKGGLKGL